MKIGNVLVIGNSGVGKSTLINAVLGEDVAKTGWGTEGTTKYLEIYENDNIPFSIIDSVGFEPSLLKQRMAINSVKKWSKNSIKNSNNEKQINVIWFCVDGTAGKLFPETIKNLSRATSMWESVPVIVVITKSYGIPDRAKNIEMVYNAFAKQKHHSKNLRKVIPVVAANYELNETAYVAPEGITELIDATNELMPEGLKAAEKDIYKFKLNRKRAFAQGVAGLATTGGVIVGAIPIPFSDAAILVPTETTAINALAKIYEINSNQLINSIVEAGTVSVVAKNLISALKAIPGINLAASVINSVIAGIVVAAICEASIYVFEQIYLGNKSIDDISWVKKVVESKLSSDVINKAKIVLENITDNIDNKSIGKIIKSIFKI